MNINQILINVGLLSVSHVFTSFFSFTLSRQTSQVVLGSQRHKATLCCSTAACCQRTTAWIGDIYFRKRLHQGSSSQDIIIYDVHLYISEYYLVQVMIHLMSKGIRSISSPMTIPVSYNFSSQANRHTAGELGEKIPSVCQPRHLPQTKSCTTKPHANASSTPCLRDQHGSDKKWVGEVFSEDLASTIL